MAESVLNLSAVPTTLTAPPRHHRSVVQQGSECSVGCLNVPHTLKLLLHRRVVSAIAFITPTYDRHVSQNSCESTLCSLDVLHIPQLCLHRAAVATSITVAPRHNRPISQDSSKGGSRGLYPLHTSQLRPENESFYECTNINSKPEEASTLGLLQLAPCNCFRTSLRSPWIL